MLPLTRRGAAACGAVIFESLPLGAFSRGKKKIDETIDPIINLFENS
jgi:hypothetical protein